MTTVHVQSDDVSADVGGARCAVCDHEIAGHDPIGRRYCEATQAQALGRRCICRPA